MILVSLSFSDQIVESSPFPLSSLLVVNNQVLEATCCEVVHSLRFLDCLGLQDLHMLRYNPIVPLTDTLNTVCHISWETFSFIIDVSKDYSAISIVVHFLNGNIYLFQHKGCKFCL